jgi:hypothetical protein
MTTQAADRNRRGERRARQRGLRRIGGLIDAGVAR